MSSSLVASSSSGSGGVEREKGYEKAAALVYTFIFSARREQTISRGCGFKVGNCYLCSHGNTNLI